MCKTAKLGRKQATRQEREEEEEARTATTTNRPKELNECDPVYKTNENKSMQMGSASFFSSRLLLFISPLSNPGDLPHFFREFAWLRMVVCSLCLCVIFLRTCVHF